MRLLKLFFFTLWFGAIIAVGIKTFFFDSEYEQLQRLKAQVNVLKEKERELQLENERLRRQIKRLQSDHTYIEWIARDELGMIRHDELLLRLPPASPQLISTPQQ